MGTEEDRHGRYYAGRVQEKVGCLEHVEGMLKVVICVPLAIELAEMLEEGGDLQQRYVDGFLHALQAEEGLEEDVGAGKHLFLWEQVGLEMPGVEGLDEAAPCLVIDGDHG